MKKMFALALAALMLLASLSVAPPRAQAQGAGLISSILNKMDRNRRDPRLHARWHQMQKYNAQLRDTDNYKGEVQYVAAKGRDANVRVDWVKPAQEILAVSGGQYTLYRPRLKQAFQGSTKNSAIRAAARRTTSLASR